MKLSIVTALKDGFDYFSQTVPSVLAQTHCDWEWIIVDDGSEKPLSSVFPKLVGDPRVKLIRYEISRGQTFGLNEGIRISQGDWIVRVDADDLFLEQRLEAILKVIQATPGKTDARLIFSDYDVIDENGVLISEVRYRLPLSPRFFDYLWHTNNPICHPSVAFYKYTPTRELYQYRSDLRNAQDYELWKRIARDWGDQSVVCIAQPLVKYRLVSSSLSGAMAVEQKRELKQIKSGEPGLQPKSGKTEQVLGGRQRQGMQAYRVLFYLWLGQGRQGLRTSSFSLLLTAMGYGATFPKALFYWLFRPLSSPLKRVLLGGVYR